MKVLYFAWLRERLNRGEEDVHPPAEVVTVGDLIQWLKSRDETFDLAVRTPAILLAAIDARRVPHTAPIAGAGTIALLPPMTGG